MVIDRQGSGNSEGSIEIPTQRGNENGPPPSPITSLISKTKKQVSDILDNRGNGGGTMSNTSLAQQIDLMQKMKSNLVKFEEELRTTREQYLKTVEYLHTEGLIGEIFNDFMEGYAEPTCSRIDNLVSHIDGNDIPAVERVISYLESYSM